MKKRVTLISWFAIAATVLATSSCQSNDERLAQFALESTQQQAAQNEEITQLNSQVADNHRRVVEAVEKSRQEINLLERQVESRRERLEAERKSLAHERRRESMLAPVIDHLGTLLVASIPLALCWLLLYGLRTPVTDDEVAGLLVHELLTAQEEKSSPERLTHGAARRLETSENSDQLPF